MSELAFNMNGDPFEVPAGAVAWRVRKMKPKGAPEVAYGRNGLPLVLPVEADLNDLRAEVNAPGKYRLDPIDAANKPIDGAPAGYVYVHELHAPAPEAPVTLSGSTNLVPLPAASDNVVIEAMRMNAEIARIVIAQFPQMLEASAVLIRAADGAGLPARPGMFVGDDDDEDDDDGDSEAEPAEPRGGVDINMLLQLVPVVMTAIKSGKSSIDLGSLFDWNKAAAKGEAARKAKADAETASAPTASPSIEEQLKADPAAGFHFMQIMSALTPAESEVLRAMAKEMSSEERTIWFNDLKALSVQDALGKLREVLAQLDKRVGAP